MSYIKLNIEPIEIEFVEDEHDATKDYISSFWWNNKRYYLQDFTRTHNNPWVYNNFPEYIHGYESDNYFHPLFIEIVGDEAVNVYEEVENDKCSM